MKNAKLIAIFFLSALLTSCAGKNKKSDSPATEPAKPTAPAKTAAQIPVEDFHRNYSALFYRISPDGKKLAFVKPWKNRLNIFTHPLHDPAAIKQLTFAEDRDIWSVNWKGTDNIVYEKDTGGDENTHVFTVNVNTGSITDLTPYDKVKSSLVDDLEQVSKTDIMIEHNRRNPEVMDLYRINIDTGEFQLAYRNDTGIKSWLIDHSGRPRGGVATDGVSTVVYFEKTAGQPWEVLLKTDFRTSFTPLAFTSDNKRIFALTNLNRNFQSLVEVDPALPSDKFIRRILFQHPRRDVDRADYSYARNTIGRAEYTTDRAEAFFLNPDDQKDWEQTKTALGNRVLGVANTSLDEKFWIVRQYTDLGCGGYTVVDRTQTESAKRYTPVPDLCPWLPSNLMSPMTTVHYKTRDGLDIEGYLTIPKGSAGKNLPVVVNPHGGPWARDSWGFNAEVQFLASRGYAVFQPNFRGSTGYGRKFWEASFKQWGGKMQNDITDGVKWLIQQGIADKNRICIYGASYGGYATLAGLTFTPNLYKCGVDYVGVSNIFTFYKSIPPYWKPMQEMLYAMVGHPEKDEKLLKSVSPAFHVQRIKAPLFVAQGANDPRVNKAESDQIVEALRKRGVQVEYMVKENEGHGFYNEENRFDFYRAMEKFLKQHLGDATGKAAL